MTAKNSIPVHRYSIVFFTFSALLFRNRVALNPMLGGVRDVAPAIISHAQTQSNRVCCFQTFDDVFPKDLLSGYFGNKSSTHADNK